MDPKYKLKKYTPSPLMLKCNTYDKAKADRAVNFVEALRHTKGEFYNKPFELIAWQEKIIRDIFGTVKKDGYRQFTTAYIEVPKKQGKSELAAAVALYLLCADGEQRAEVYGCAADRAQAEIVFLVACDMIKLCPALAKRCTIIPSKKRIVYEPTASYYQVLSADVAGKSGFNVSGLIFDELWVQPNRKLYDMMTQGTSDARKNPLHFIITTAGDNLNSVCYEQHKKAEEILRGKLKDPSFYPVIFGADEKDDWTSKKTWKKANPSLGITVDIEKVEAAFVKAKQSPADEKQFRQLRLNQWQRSSTRWMPSEAWAACAFDIDKEVLKGRVCYGGLDLSSTGDITAFVLVFPPLDEHDKYVVLPYFWIPEECVERRVTRDHVPYDDWVAKNIVKTTEGDVIHYAYIEQQIKELNELYNIRSICYDRWGATQISQDLEAEGFDVIPFGQGFASMSPPTKQLMELVLEKRINHGGNIVLDWMMDNVYVRSDPAGNIKMDKAKSTEKIDGAVAMVMALDRAIRCGNDAGESVYDSERGLLFI